MSATSPRGALWASASWRAWSKGTPAVLRSRTLTSQVAEAIMGALDPDGVAVVIEAEHLCMTMRGVKKPGSRMVTSAMRGQFKRSDVTRAEFLSLVRKG